MRRRVVLRVVLGMLLVLPACRFLPRWHSSEAAPEHPDAIDLNTASLRKVEGLPGITPSMARRIVDGRPYTEPDDLVERGILTRRELDRILDRVVIKDRGR
jgi:hypothetical protein